MKKLDFTPTEIGYIYSSIKPETCDGCFYYDEDTDKELPDDCENECRNLIRRLFTLIQTASINPKTILACDWVLNHNRLIEQSKLGGYSRIFELCE